ncbi:arabinosyltransferase C [Mycolicibacterium iranicum]|uniref:Arabinosyltransferase C n=2 Tax=Mycolicibacterium iranicum TaxID=912594 RepID=A0A839Q5I1_MYCIR|nr:arabinosyltransferase C [Mycolicibacterium iranicum]
MRTATSRRHTWIALLVGLTGVLTALALPFAPVLTETTTLTWPAPGRPATSSTTLLAPDIPAALTVSIPCSVLRAGATRPAPTTLFATAPQDTGLTITASRGQVRLRLGDREEQLDIPAAPRDCQVRVDSATDGVTILEADGRVTLWAGAPAPRVAGFHTDLGAGQTSGLSATVVVSGPFATTPTVLKGALVVIQLFAAGVALLLLFRGRAPPVRRARPWRWRWRWRRAWWIDVAVAATLAGWAVIGPLAVDDGWATMIARNVAATGNPGNYYRWWDAAEVPFAFSQQLLAPLTQLSIAPLWLRLPGTLAALATWFVVSRGVLGGALPGVATTARVRTVAAAFFLAAWLPFNLGTRPESYVALGVAASLALAWRARDGADLGLLALVAALTVPVSPNGVLVVAPMIVLAPRLIRAARRTGSGAVTAALVSCVGAVGLTVIFGDQTWDSLVTATDWHTTFGPALPWYEEPTRYEHLLQPDQQGSFAKRLPVLIGVALLPIVGALTLRRADRDRIGLAALRMGAVVVVALLLLAAGPSKWSYHLGALAGVFTSFSTLSVVLLVRRARAPDRRVAMVGVAGSALLAATAALAFAGPNAWWLPAVYDLPWATGPIRPAGVPLDSPLLWAGVLAAGGLTVLPARRFRRAQVCALSPAVVTVVAVGISLCVLAGTFAAAPLRRSAGSLALINAERLTGTRVCGLADDIELLPDGPILAAAEPGGGSSGFTGQGGYLPIAPPPDPPGTGASTFVWGSRTPDAQTTGEITTQWFTLPPLSTESGVALSVSGRTSGANVLELEFGRFDGAGVEVLGAVAPVDRPAVDEDPAHPLWRSVGVDAVDAPAGADRVRVRAVDGRTDDAGWLAFTGPRLRTIVPLNSFLAGNGPVLVSWPQAFLFPCVHDIPTVSAGVAQTPQTVIDSPRPWLTEDRDEDVGGVFAGLDAFVPLNEIPSRLAGHPEVDWGSVKVRGDTAAPDAYARSTTREKVWGIGASRGPRPGA